MIYGTAWGVFALLDSLAAEGTQLYSVTRYGGGRVWHGRDINDMTIGAPPGYEA